MTSDDDRVAELAGDGGASLGPADLAELEDLKALLADPSVWAEPDAALEDRVVAAISAEASGRVPGRPVASRPQARRHRGRWLAVVGVAAAAVIAVAVSLAVRNTGTSAPHFSMALKGDLVPSATGEAHLTKTQSGWRIELDATGLPRLDNGQFYEAWLKNAAGVLVPVGTFNDARNVTLWSGVPVTKFRSLTVTQQVANGNPKSSGLRVLTGTIH